VTQPDTLRPVTVVSGFPGSGIDWLWLKDRLGACLVPEHLAEDPHTLPDRHDPSPVWRRAEAT